MKEKRAKRAQLFEQMKALDTAAGKEGLNAEQQAQWDRIDAEINSLQKEIESEERSEQNKVQREERMKALEAELKDKVNDRKEDLGKKEDRKEQKPDEYRAAFRKWMQSGRSALNEQEFRSLEQRALSAGSSVDGGYLIPPEEMVMDIIKAIDDQVFIAAMSMQKTLSKAASIGIPTRTARASDAEWTTELVVGSADSALQYGKRVMVPHKLSKKILVSKQLIFQSPFGVEQEVNSEFGYVFGITEEKAFLTGSGVGQPLGVFTASADGISTGRDITASSTTAFNGDDLINVLYNMKGFYQNRASWLASREFIKRCRKLKDGDGQYLWQMGLQAGQPDRLLGRPAIMSEFAPSTFTTGQYVAVCGDFSSGYLVLRALQMQLQRLVEVYAEQGQVAFIGELYADGAPVKEECFSRLILA